MLKRLFILGAAAASAGAAIGFSRARTEYRTWGIDPADVAKELPGDDIVPEADAVDTRSLDIAAPPKDVWPWLVQMGYGRAGWYSWDQLDMNTPSADRIVPELQTLAVGDIVPTHPGGGFEVRILKPEQALVLYADRELVEAQAETAKAANGGIADASSNVRATGLYLDKTMQGDFRASWAFVLEATPGGGTRLIERFRGHMAPAPAVEGIAQPARMPPRFAGTMLLFGLFVMVRRQLQGIRDRAEGRPISPSWFASILPKAPTVS
jgi:proline iminopeptidase